MKRRFDTVLGNHWVALAAFSMGASLVLELAVTLEWSFQSCQRGGDGPAPAVFGAPLPYERWAGTSLEYDFVPWLYVFDILVLAALILLPMHRFTSRWAKGSHSRAHRMLGGVGALACVLVVGWKTLAVATFWHPLPSLPVLLGESIRELRPIRVTSARPYECRPSALSGFWFGSQSR